MNCPLCKGNLALSYNNLYFSCGNTLCSVVRLEADSYRKWTKDIKEKENIMDTIKEVKPQEFYKQVGLTRLSVYPLTVWDQGFIVGFFALFGIASNPYSEKFLPSERKDTDPSEQWREGWFEGNSIRRKAGR